jgi:uncharacterized protein
LWYEDLKQNKQPYIRVFENYIAILCGYQPESCDMLGICGIQYAVEADGSVYPCDFYMLDEFLLGNLNKDNISELDKKREKIGFILRSKALAPECVGCRYHYICKGGCYRHREQSLHQNRLNYYCQSYKIFFNHAERILIDISKKILSKNKGIYG